MIEGVHFVRKRNVQGIAWYVYAFRGGPCVLRSEGAARPKLGPTELRAVTKAIEERETPKSSSTLFTLIRRWRHGGNGDDASPEWKALSPNTQKTWGSALGKIEEKWADVPLALFDDSRMIEKIVNWRDSRSETPRAADIGVDVLKALLRYGVQRGMLRTNIAAGIGKLYRGGQREEIVWTDDDMERFAAKAQETGEIGAWDALRLASSTGLRREDLCTVTDHEIGDHAIVKKAKKSSRGRRRFATVPRIPELNALLAELTERPRARGVATILVNADGLPWAPDLLTKAIGRVRDAAKIAHVDPETGKVRKKHLHDARGTFATKLMTTTDLTDAEIADIMGWSPTEVARIRKVYVDQRATVVAIGKRIARGVNRPCKPE